MMRKIDIREQSGDVGEITFAEVSRSDYYADSIRKRDFGYTGFEILENDTGRVLLIRDREHLDNLIKALEEAKKLGWV